MKNIRILLLVTCLMAGLPSITKTMNRPSRLHRAVSKNDSEGTVFYIGTGNDINRVENNITALDAVGIDDNAKGSELRSQLMKLYLQSKGALTSDKIRRSLTKKKSWLDFCTIS